MFHSCYVHHGSFDRIIIITIIDRIAATVQPPPLVIQYRRHQHDINTIVITVIVIVVIADQVKPDHHHHATLLRTCKKKRTKIVDKSFSGGWAPQMHLEVAPVIKGLHFWQAFNNGVFWWPELPPSAFVAFKLQKNDLTTIFVRYFLHVWSSVDDDDMTRRTVNIMIEECL